MMQKDRVQYIRFYTDGTAARKLEIAVPQHKIATLPEPRKVKYKKVYVDPVAIVGVLAAVFMLIVMVAGMVQLKQAQQEVAAMEAYVDQLTQENQMLQAEYDASYDLETIEKTALALGMVPSAEAPETVIWLEVPEPEPEPTFFETIGTFLTGLFA